MKSILYFSLATLLMSSTARAQMGPPTPLTPSQFAATSSGQNVTLAIRVNGFSRTALVGDLLERVTDSRYKKTGTRVSLYVPPDVPLVMGSISDVKPGAVIFIFGVTTTAAHADVKKIIVLTPYAKVE